MSRIGKSPVEMPDGVKANINKQEVSIEGPKGQLTMTVHPKISVKSEDGVLKVSRPDDTRQSRSLHGLTRSLINNMVQGVHKGYTRGLEIQGVGYRAEAKGKELHLALGFSHPVIYPLPEGIKAVVDGSRTKITLEGIDKQLIGATAAKIRSFRPPEPYRGKGVRYANEVVRRKEGKSAAK